MKFRMKVDDLFRIGNKTIFAGVLETTEIAISRTICSVQIDGKEIGEIQIDGEVENGTGHRDLWTASRVDLDRNILSQCEVWLVAK